MIRFTALILCLLAAAALAGCGGEEGDNAVEATEANTVELDGVRYRVPIFRELNVRDTPDDAIFDGPPPPDGSGYYVAFLNACNPTGSDVGSTAQATLEDAYGQRFEPLPEGTDDDFGYRPQPLAAEECIPRDGSPAERVGNGAALVFEVPFDSIAERPLVLELDAGGETRRIQLDV